MALFIDRIDNTGVYSLVLGDEKPIASFNVRGNWNMEKGLNDLLKNYDKIIITCLEGENKEVLILADNAINGGTKKRCRHIMTRIAMIDKIPKELEPFVREVRKKYI